jgi:hypothetical protein
LVRQDTIKSAEYVGTMERTSALKQQVASLDRRIRDRYASKVVVRHDLSQRPFFSCRLPSKASIAVDEPTRVALEQEVSAS